MYKLLLRFWGWLCSKESIRHFLCIFLIGRDPKRDGSLAQVYEDMTRYWTYTTDPENADPELREFALRFEAERREEKRICLVRDIFDCVLAGLGIFLVGLLAIWASMTAQDLMEKFEQASAATRMMAGIWM